MGGLLAFRVDNFDNTAEREQFRFLCEQLKAHYENSNDFCVFVGNYNIGCELDALFIKKDAIIVIEFKNYGGNVIATENGEWKCDGQNIKGGSRKTVLQQARINHSIVKKELKLLGVESKNIKDLPSLVVFNQPINLDNELSATTKSWLHITDNEHFIEKLDDITCPKTDITPLGIVNIAETLNLNPFYLEEFSNANYVYDNVSPNINIAKHESDIDDNNIVQGVSIDILDHNSLKLPKWLDNLIYEELGANYSCTNKNMVVLDWKMNEILNYLGTYFPRSFTEGYFIFKENALLQKEYLENKKSISIFDFGCGTGGELVGMIIAIKEKYPTVDTIKIKALDGNVHAIRVLEYILKKLSDKIGIEILFSPMPIAIDDFYDLGIVANTLSESFDYIISFKAICEFVTKQQFDKNNPYEYILNTFMKKLSDGGCFFLADITSYSGISQEWLPRMLDKGISNTILHLVASNSGYNEEFIISHSRKKNDISKIAWRILRNKK